MTVFFIEDEGAALRRIEKMVLEAAPDAVVAGSADSVESAVEWLNNHPAPDLIFMDIHLADGSSFDIFDYIQVRSTVIFTTAYDEYALKAFKVSALDYLMKPVKAPELEAAIARFRQKNNVPDYASAFSSRHQSETALPMRRMLVRLGQSIRVVEMDDIAYFYTRDKISFLVNKSQGKRYPIDFTLDKLENMLDKTQFYRINRQFIIHISAIREMHPYSKSRIKVELVPEADSEIVVSSEKTADFKSWLTGYQ